MNNELRNWASIVGSKGRALPPRLGAYLRVSAGVVALLANSAAWAQQMPTGGSVAAGSATIAQPNANTLNINQSTNQAIINWNSFSIGQGGTVNFNQPSSSSATLNRVLGSTPSSIAGTINANGTVLLVNPNGIAITKSGLIKTNSFAASTLDISNADFMAGNYKFTGNGSSAAVKNSGRINVADGGFAALLGGQVANNGVISARLGKVGLGAGELITLDLAGDGFLSVAVPSSQLGNLVDANGALVSNRGRIRADGGQVFLSAATASTLLRDAVNVPGSIRANTVGTNNGRIVIGGGDGGKVKVTGRLAANGNSQRSGGKIEVAGAAVSLNGKVTANGKTGGAIAVASTGDLAVSGEVAAKGSDGQGGRIDLAGANIKVVGALIDASGSNGGGLVRIGGTFQGGNGDPNDPLYQSFVGRFGALPDIASAQTVTIDAGSKIDVSAKTSGDGGTAIVWSDVYTADEGAIAGTGGSSGGNGGFAEVSGKALLNFVGSVNLLGSDDTAGTLLLDPRNVTIVAGLVGAISGGVYDPGADDSQIGAATIVAALASANVTITTGSTGSQSGNITVSSAISWTGSGSTAGNFGLTLNAAGNILVNASITATKTTANAHDKNSITLIAGNDITIGSGITFTTSNNNQTGAYAISLVAGRNISVGSSIAITNSGATNILLRADSGGTGVGTVTFASSAIKATSSGGIVSIFYNPSVNPAGSAINSTSYVSPTESYTGNRGTQTTLNSYMLVNTLSDLQNMKNNLTGNYGLGRNIDASATAGWNGGLGFAPIGSAVSDGTGIPVGDTTFGVSSATPFAGNFNGQNYTISNLTINRPNADYVGLFGYAYNAANFQLIQGVNLVGGSITGRDHVGSVIGGNRGYGQNGNLNLNDYNNSSTSSATVTGRDFVGGLYGSLEGVYAYNVNGNGIVSGRDYVGGIVGWLSASSGYFTDFRSTATVSGRNNVGGMAGFYASNLYGLSYATGNVTATGDNVGGFIGYSKVLLGSGVGDNYYASGAVSGVNNVGGFAGFHDGDYITQTFATGAVTGTMNVGGLVGNLDYGSIDLSFATGVVRGTTNVGGLVGRNANLIGANYPTFKGGTYATGAVYGVTNVGGLVGLNIGDSTTTYGRINSSYATGYVSGTTNVGGLVGNSTVSGASGFIKNSYFNTETSGKANALGAGTTGTGGILLSSMPKSTSELKSGLPAGLDSSIWAIVTNVTFPYFKWLYPTAPQVVSGTAYSDRGTTVLAGTAANMLVSGLTGTAANVAASVGGSTGANGYFYFLAPNGTFFPTAKQVLVYTAGANGGATFNETTATAAAATAVTGLNIYGTYLKEQATSTSTLLSIVTADLALAVNSNTAAQARLASLANLEIDATASSFTIDRAISTGTLVLSGTGAWTQSAAISASNLLLLGTAGSYTLTNANNAIGTIAANTGTINIFDSAALVVGTVAGTNGVTGTGAVTLASAGNLTIAAAARVTAGNNANVVLSAGGNFINNRGNDAISVSGTGRWLVYSLGPDNDVFGNLNSGNTAVWNTTYPTAVSATGNRYVFAYQPTLTFTSTDTTKTYGDTASLAAAYAVSGLQAGVTNAFLGDTASAVYGGAPTLASAGTAGTADVAGGPYDITISSTGLTSLVGYAFAFSSAGKLTVTARALTVTGGTISRTYGDNNPSTTADFTAPTGSAGSGSGLVNGDTIGTVTVTTAASAASDVGGYDYTPGSASFSNGSAGNYQITYFNGTLNVTARALTVTADAQNRTYGDANPALTYQVTTGNLVNGDTLSGTLATVATATSDVGSYTITQGGVTSANNTNYNITYAAADLTIGQRALTITADDKTRDFSAPNPLLTATYSGFVNGDSASVVSGLTLATAAASGSPAGAYAIDAAGGTALNYAITLVNGVLTVTGRAPVITVQVINSPPTSQVNPSPSTPSGPQVTIPSSPTTGGIVQVSFTPAPPARVASTPSTDVSPASLSQGQDLATNNGQVYAPISQFDPNQYSEFKLPDSVAEAGVAAIFAMIARGVDKERASEYLIDKFLAGNVPTWNTALDGKVTFSDGAGNNVNPTGHAGFPVVAGATDFGLLLKSGPVMISGGGQPAHWLLATQMTADGKGIVANDPATGKQVILNYDASTKTVGGVTGVFDTNSNKFVSFADASVSTPSLSGLQGFVPSAFIAVAAK